VYDACVLYPAPLRDFLMWLALSGAFRARWSAVIAAAQRQRRQLKSPAMDVDRFLDNLLRQGLVQTVKSLATYKAIL
jgi:hypothetical protein